MNYLWQKIKQFKKWLIGFFIGATALAAGQALLPVDETKFDIHKGNIATKFEQQVVNASSTLPFSKENATFRKYDKETSGFLTIGDKTKDVFVPEFTISNWKETKFRVSVPTKKASKNQTLSFPTQAKQKLVRGKMQTATTSKLKWTDGVNDAVFYELDNGDFEFEYILYSIPASNVISFDIQTQGLDFFYQPALDVEMASTTCTATDCGGSHRPENVVGSYAVYHKTQQGDYSALGGENYKTGKAFHIYRPKIIDNMGDWVWGEMDINTTTGKLSITIDQNWLNNAVYPVIVDPTFGNTVAGVSTIGPLNDDAYGLFADSTVSSGTVTQVSFYGEEQVSTSLVKMLIVDNVSGFPIITNGVTDPVTVDTNVGWWNATFTTEPTISSGTDYLLGIISGDWTAGRFHYDTVTSAGWSDSTNNYTTPQDLSTVTTQNRKHSIYATYTTATPTIADFSHFRTLTLCGNGGTNGCAATTTTNGYAILATTTQSTLAATSSSGRIEKTTYDSANNIEKPLDLIFTNDADTLLDFEIEKYSTTTGELVAWIDVDDISSTTAKTFKMYYGNASATGYENPQDTWNSTYAGVWHLPEDPSGTAPQMLDSTANNNDGTTGGSMTTSDQVDTQVNGGLDFDGVGDIITVSDDDSMDWGTGGSFSISQWLTITTNNTTRNTLFDKGSTVGWVFMARQSSTQRLRLDGTNSDFTTGGTDIYDQALHHVAVTVDLGDTAYYYVDGTLVDTNDISALTTNVDSTSDMTMSTTAWDHKGIMDEVRIYNTSIDPMDILTDYNMSVDNTTFLSFGAEQETAVADNTKAEFLPWLPKLWFW